MWLKLQSVEQHPSVILARGVGHFCGLVIVVLSEFSHDYAVALFLSSSIMVTE